uniref:JmjC domain-containing protein 4 n=1 Tax=Cajanus cajan TaxID=3821 RepID=A0A151SGL4_CAJCA|nr:JmjC domain-containing protein 4 [Cajanus cajan]
MGINVKGQIERVNGKELSYTEFVERYMEKNQPVVLTGLMDPHHWRASTDWVTLQGQPNFHFFSTHFGPSKVQVADCDTREFTDQKREEMLVSDFIGRCLQLEASAAQCNDENGASGGSSESVPYLKDWHFVKVMFGPVSIFAFCHKFYCFQLHFSASAFSGCLCMQAIWLECTQDAGEIIFVPSGWYHQVHNLEDTISINHNWFNGYNLSWVWNLLLRDYNEAKEYIEDIKDICDDFEGLCQRNLAANTGMNFYDFFTFMSYFALANLVILRYINRRYGSTTGSSSTIAQHLSMNLGCLRKIASEMKHMHALEGNQDCVVDVIKAFLDPRFSKLCMHVGRTYTMIHEQSHLSSDFESTSMSDLVDLNDMKAYTSQINTPEDLIKFIDNGVAELSDCSIEPSVPNVA